MKSISCPLAAEDGHRKNNSLLALFLLLVFPGLMPAQIPFVQTAPDKYRITFTDKDNNPFSLSAPEVFLSAASLARRQAQGISVNHADLPVTPAYLDSIRKTGATILTVSKWFNAVTIRTDKDTILQQIAAFPFVKKEETGQASHLRYDKYGTSGIQSADFAEDFHYGLSEWQTAVHHGDILHSNGFTGQGKTIAVIDAGFYHVDRLPAFEVIRSEGRILGTRDFVSPGSNVYEGHTHGMVVLSIIGGILPGELIGTAPDASFWLLRSEDTGSEYPIEEDNWVSAAEFADSAGADIINTSLGYSTFDDTSSSHTYSEMDGNTTRISRAADMAAARGMLVVVSAGNQGAAPWYYISAPADADSVLAVAAMDEDLLAASFSSHGPSSDGRVKPDVTAIGKGTWMADPVTGTRQGNGTSLSAPVITGLTACLWQAVPETRASDLIRLIRISSDRYTSPDEVYGYGIPDYNLALQLARLTGEEGDAPVVFPNPFSNLCYVVLPRSVDGEISLTFTDLSGRTHAARYFPPMPERTYLRLDDLQELPKGIYLLKLNAGVVNYVAKLLKF